MRCTIVTHVAHLLASSSWSAHEHKLPSSCSAHAVYSSYVVLSKASTVALPVGTTTSDKGNKHAQLAGAPTGCSTLTSFVHGLQRVCKGGQILVACIIPTPARVTQLPTPTPTPTHGTSSNSYGYAQWLEQGRHGREAIAAHICARRARHTVQTVGGQLRQG